MGAPNGVDSRKVVLGLHAVSAGYGEQPVVRDIDITVREGEVVALFGPNGAGKSTTLLTAIGRLPPSQGRVQWWDLPKPPAPHRLARLGVSYVPEGRSVISSMSVSDNLKLGAGGVDGAVGLFPELGKLLNRPAGLLSGGEQQMLVLARALARKPRAVLLDELSLGLAPLIVERLIRVLRQVARTEGLTVVMVEQQARRAIGLADRWYLLRNGRVVDEGDAHAGVERLTDGYLVGAPAADPTKPNDAA
jgi:branched-chain amino acid transport system ATP-binding protein